MASRQDFRKAGIGYTRLAADTAANEVQIGLLDASQRQAAIAALSDLLTPPNGPASLADFVVGGKRQPISSCLCPSRPWPPAPPPR